MKIIIAGAGEVGSHLAKILSNDYHDITVIDPDEHRLKQIDSYLDILTVTGSATSLEILKDANIQKTDLFIAVAHYEDTNITAAILGKKFGAKKTIARIDNQEYLLPQWKHHFTELGIDYLIYPEKIAAREVLGFLHQTGTTEFFDFSGGKLSLYVIKLDEDATILDRSLAEIMEGTSMEYRAVAIKRNEDTIIPKGHDTFQVGDHVYVVSTKAGFNDLMKFSGKKTMEIKNIMILGGSRIGKRTAQELEKKYNVKLVEIDNNKCHLLADILEKTLIINGDGRDTELLMEEGLPEMDAFIAVTGNSETNILSCLLAKELGVSKTIAEVENMEYINLAEHIGVDSIINKKITAAGRISRFTQAAKVSMIKCLTGTEAEVLEFVAKDGSRIIESPLKDLKFPKDAIVGGVIRGNSSFIAQGDTHIHPNDRVVVFALPSALQKLEKFFS
jgi:trk system potassium uptake protein TrkA